MEALTKFFSRFDFSLSKTFAGDLSLLFLFIGISLVLGFVFGRYKLVNILINVYIGLAVVAVLPEGWLDFSLYGEAITFLAVLVVLTLVDQRLFDIHMSNAGTDFFWRLIVTSLLVTGLIVSVLLSYLPEKTALQFISESAYQYFASPTALLFWTILPIVSLFFINKRLR